MALIDSHRVLDLVIEINTSSNYGFYSNICVHYSTCKWEIENVHVLMHLFVYYMY